MGCDGSALLAGILFLPKSLIKTTERQKSICLALLKLRRSKKYGEKDGHPVAFSTFLEIIPDLKIEELNQLVSLGICWQTQEGKYEFINSKNMTGINGIYRIILPTADIIPTLTATAG
jgi:DNA (cytosine-5)-methyltransferase 1